MAVHITSRADAEAIIREQVVSTIFQDAPKQSVFMSLARKLPNMTSNQTRIRVLDFLPTAYWVNGDTGMKQTSKQAWDNVYINAAELAVIIGREASHVREEDVKDYIFGYTIINDVSARTLQTRHKQW